MPNANESGSGDITGRVRNCIAEVLGIDAASVGDDAVLLDLGADSVAFMDLVFKLERMFGIVIPRRFARPDVHRCDDYVHVVRALVSGAAETSVQA